MSWQTPFDDFQRRYIDQRFVLVVNRVKVRRCVITPKHLDHDAVKEAKRWHQRSRSAHSLIPAGRTPYPAPRIHSAFRVQTPRYASWVPVGIRLAPIAQAHRLAFSGELHLLDRFLNGALPAHALGAWVAYDGGALHRDQAFFPANAFRPAATS